MAVCNNYKYLYQYINKKANEINQTLGNRITRLSSRVTMLGSEGARLLNLVKQQSSQISILQAQYNSLVGSMGSTTGMITQAALESRLAQLDDKYFNKTTGDTIAAGKAITFEGSSNPTISYSGNKMSFANSLEDSLYGFKMGSKEIILGVDDGSSYIGVDKVNTDVVNANTIKVENLEVTNLGATNYTGTINWSQIEGAPDLTIPENVSAFTNDAGYVTDSAMQTAINNWALNFTNQLGSRYVVRDSDGVTITTGNDSANVKITDTGISRTVNGETQWAVFGDVEAIPLEYIDELPLH